MKSQKMKQPDNQKYINISIETKDIYEKEFKLLKYQSSLINLINITSQATRPRYIGSTSELSREFISHQKKNKGKINVLEWKKFYLNKKPKNVDYAIEKNWIKFNEIKQSMEKITREDIKNWVEDLVFKKTIMGSEIEVRIFEYLKNNYPKHNWQLASPEYESKNIDILCDEYKITVKPHTYFQKEESKLMSVLLETNDFVIRYSPGKGQNKEKEIIVKLPPSLLKIL